MGRLKNNPGAIAVLLFWVITGIGIPLSLVVSAQTSWAQTSWVSTGGPLGGLGYDVRIDPNNSNNMFVTDNWAGVIKSENAGQSWFQSN
jgi:hypothetical protein